MGKFDFTKQEKQQIENAIKALERESSGEIVVFVAEKSDSYIEACWKAAAFFGFSPLLTCTVLAHLWLIPSFFDILNLCIILIISTIIGALFPLLIPNLRLVFISDNKIKKNVLMKARDMFLQEEVFNTKQRTGILIYISKFERLIEIIGDSGINAKIESNDWENIVELVQKGIKNGNTANGLIQAINSCKILLLENGFKVRNDDANELSDKIRVE